MSTVSQLPGWWAYDYRRPPTLVNDGTLWTGAVGFITTQSNLKDFVSVVAGLPPTIIPTSYGNITRIITLQDPLYDWMYAKRVRCESFGTPSATSTALKDLHSHVRVSVEFESIPFATFGDQAFMSFNARGGSLYTTISGRKMTFSNGEVIGQDAGVMVGQVSYSLRLFQCPTRNESVIQPLTGTINNATFFNQPAGRVRFDTWESNEEVSIGGVTQYQKSLNFTIQNHHWNQFYRMDGTLDTATDPAGNPAYQLADFSALLAT